MIAPSSDGGSRGHSLRVTDSVSFCFRICYRLCLCLKASAVQFNSISLFMDFSSGVSSLFSAVLFPSIAEYIECNLHSIF